MVFNKLQNANMCFNSRGHLFMVIIDIFVTETTNRKLYIMKSIDGGMSFTNIKNDVAYYSIHDAKIICDKNDDVYVIYSGYDYNTRKEFLKYCKIGSGTWNLIDSNNNESFDAIITNGTLKILSIQNNKIAKYFKIITSTNTITSTQIHSGNSLKFPSIKYTDSSDKCFIMDYGTVYTGSYVYVNSDSDLLNFYQYEISDLPVLGRVDYLSFEVDSKGIFYFAFYDDYTVKVCSYDKTEQVTNNLNWQNIIDQEKAEIIPMDARKAQIIIDEYNRLHVLATYKVGSITQWHGYVKYTGNIAADYPEWITVTDNGAVKYDIIYFNAKMFDKFIYVMYFKNGTEIFIKKFAATLVDWLFDWDLDKIPKEDIAFTANEWNKYTAAINIARKAYNLIPITFTQVSATNTITASIFNQAINALQELKTKMCLSVNEEVPTTKKGAVEFGYNDADAIKALYFNQLRDALNSVQPNEPIVEHSYDYKIELMWQENNDVDSHALLNRDPSKWIYYYTDDNTNCRYLELVEGDHSKYMMLDYDCIDETNFNSNDSNGFVGKYAKEIVTVKGKTADTLNYKIHVYTRNEQPVNVIVKVSKFENWKNVLIRQDTITLNDFGYYAFDLKLDTGVLTWVGKSLPNVSDGYIGDEQMTTEW